MGMAPVISLKVRVNRLLSAFGEVSIDYTTVDGLSGKAGNIIRASREHLFGATVTRARR